MKDLIINARKYREELLKDPYRPGYHFAIPDGNGMPGDPNGAFYADGRYHLMYLYYREETDSYNWGHISSMDLLHWQHHPDALRTYKGDRGANSGGGFVDRDGRAYISFWKFPSKDYESDNGGLAIAYADSPYEVWKRIEPVAVDGSRDRWGVLDIEVDGEVEHVCCADPSNIWKKDGYYYMLAGSYHVSYWHGKEENSPQKYKGGWTDLFKSKDMKNWEFAHRFFEYENRGGDWADETEDNMCPCFFPLPDKKSHGSFTDKYIQLFISHNKGCQYYIGKMEDEVFYPEQHGRMTWRDIAYGPPEMLMDEKNRLISWSWLCDNFSEDEFQKFGWSGVFSFPRILWYEDEILHMAPADELDLLQYNPQTFQIDTVLGEKNIAVKNGKSFRLKCLVDMKSATFVGVKIKINSDNDEDYTEIYYDKKISKIVFSDKKHYASTLGAEEAAPFSLRDGEKLFIDLFVDKSVVEIYVNERQGICRRVYSENPEKSVGVSIISDGGDFGKVLTFEMSPSNFY